MGANLKVVSLDKIEVHKNVEHVFGDLTNFDVCLENTKNMDFVFHIAGIKGSIKVTKSKPATFFVPLLMNNTNLLEAARLNNIKKLVYTSSIGAYASSEIFKEDQDQKGDPMDTYPGWAKRMAELQIKAYKAQYGLDWSIVRPCNVYGPGDNFDPNNAMVIPSLMMRIHNGEDPLSIWGDGSSVRDFAYSRDVAEGIILALHHGTRGEFVNLGSGKGITIKKLLTELNRFIDFNYEFNNNMDGGFPKRIMDISRARSWINYNPSTTLLDGLKETWKWFQENNDEYLKRKNYFI